MQIGMALSVCIPVADGSYVMADAVNSIEITRTGNGESWLLRGYSAELGTTTDAQAMRQLQAHLELRPL